MDSRVEKNQEIKVPVSRTTRNESLYKDISKAEITNFEVKSNEEIIGRSPNSIDVEKIKSILDTHYNDTPKRNSIRIEKETEKKEVKPMFETKEYDLNTIIDKAKDEKNDDYAENRNKKIRDTQFDILSNLNLNDYIEDYEEDRIIETKEKEPNEDLQRLIDTITINENEIQKAKIKLPSDKDDEKTLDDALDIFEDLKGDEGTAVLEGLSEEIKEEKDENKVDKAFYTNSSNFKAKDFEDFKDLEDKPTSIFVKIIVIILILLFLAGIAILVKTFL